MAAWHRLSRTSEQFAENPRLYSDEWSAAHRAYHHALVNACGNRKLLQIRAQLYEQAERYRRYSGVVSKRERDVAGEHRLLFEATIARDTQAASKAISDHLRLTADIIIGSATLNSGAPAGLANIAEPFAAKAARIA